MSRCFPFPPPGYEKKIRVDETDLLEKEKRKEKKHKKDKKDKEKREGKEKKDKERSKDRHKEKTEKTEKRGDGKGKDRDKEKIRTSDEKKTKALPDEKGGEKLGTNFLQNNNNGDSKYVHDLARRIRDDEKATGSQVDQKIKIQEQRSAGLPGKTIEHNHRDPFQESTYAREEDKRVVGVKRKFAGAKSSGVDTDQRIRDGEKANGSQVGQKIKLPNQSSAGLRERTIENKNCYSQETANIREDDKRVVVGQRNFAMAKCSGDAVAREFSDTDQKRVEGTAYVVEKKDVEKQMEAKEKTPKKESDGRSDKLKDKVTENKSQLKVKNGDKDKIKEQRVKEITRPSQEQPKFIGGGPRLKERDKDSLDTCNGKPPDLLSTSNKNLAGEGTLGKRKEIETNGFLYENGNRPNKFQKSVLENGRKLPPSQTPNRSASELHGAVTDCKPEIKEPRVNGFIKAKQPKVLPVSSLPPTVQTTENGEPPEKAPHPDSRYLNQILTIPKKEFLEFDDQEWLFGKTDTRQKKPKIDSPGFDETPQVWDMAFRIESADVSALPYVIPY